MQYEYKTIHDTRSVANLERAEKLQAEGWEVCGNGIWSIMFRREKQPTLPTTNRRKTSKRKPRK